MSSNSEAAQAELRQSIANAFCKVMNRSGLPPMTVMTLAATVIGAIYREVADQHLSANACPCGWQPDPEADVEILQAALATATEGVSFPDLRTARVAGRA